MARDATGYCPVTPAGPGAAVPSPPLDSSRRRKISPFCVFMAERKGTRESGTRDSSLGSVLVPDNA